MKGLKAIATQTKNIKQDDTSTWIDLYYSIDKQTAYTRPGEGRTLVTRLIRPNTEKEIRDAINRWLSL